MWWSATEKAPVPRCCLPPTRAVTSTCQKPGRSKPNWAA